MKSQKKQAKVEKVMKEFKKGELRSGSKKGPVVKNPKQAVAIALSEQRKAGGATMPMGKAILYELTQRADQPEFRLSHDWREGDVIVWDNRAVLHRATYYDAVKYKRLMQRTTISGEQPTVAQ